MLQFHGEKKRRRFFEGWYLKHQNAAQTLALIPAYHVDTAGQASASLQIIADRQSFHIPFSAADFYANPRQFHVQLGRNHFDTDGILLDVHTPSCHLTGALSYGPWHLPETDIMGPFRFLPFLQCNHGILSLFHSVAGTLTLNGTPYCFDADTGYIEKDWGTSFPSAYLWTQTNDLDTDSACIMLALATVPIGTFPFTGCICAIVYQGKSYRLATYCGVRILAHSPTHVLLEQGSHRLHVQLLHPSAQPLQAPVRGNMSRVIHESPSCRVRYRFWEGSQLLFDHISERASFEYSAPESADTGHPVQTAPDIQGL